MKSSYLLYGAFWDGMPIPKSAPKILRSCDLTDMTVLSLKERFEDNTPAQMQDNVSELVIMIDYFPSYDKRGVVEFYLIRLLQIAEFYNANLCCDDELKVQCISKCMSEYYKKKNTA